VGYFFRLGGRGIEGGNGVLSGSRKRRFAIVGDGAREQTTGGDDKRGICWLMVGGEKGKVFLPVVRSKAGATVQGRCLPS